MDIQFLGASREVTGSCYLFQVGKRRFLVDCGLVQGSFEHEKKNWEPFPFDAHDLDAVVLTHAHLDHSGRLPRLIKAGFRGYIYTHRATAALCKVMLEDAAYLNEKETERYNRYRRRNGQDQLEPLYDQDDVYTTVRHFKTLDYGEEVDILPGVTLKLHDAGHILGSAIVELDMQEGDLSRRVVLSGDLGHAGAPILADPACLRKADLVVMESTYGDRCHRPWEATWEEMGEIIRSAHSGKGNILIPSFAVGRTQELLYVFARNHAEWNLQHWHVFLDSPMAIETTELYRRYNRVYDRAARAVQENHGDPFQMPNLRLTKSAEESMRINDIRAGAIVIAGSGMCTGGRIVHHLKRNLPYEQAHVLIVGFQARGTMGRALVDGAKTVRLFGDDIPVRAQIHTVGGLSAHADQAGLAGWYGNFDKRPPVALVHGEPEAMDTLAGYLRDRFQARVHCPEPGTRLSLGDI